MNFFLRKIFDQAVGVAKQGDLTDETDLYSTFYNDR